MPIMSPPQQSEELSASAQIRAVLQDEAELRAIAVELTGTDNIPSQGLLAEYFDVTTAIVNRAEKTLLKQGLMPHYPERIDRKGRIIQIGNVGKTPKSAENRKKLLQGKLKQLLQSFSRSEIISALEEIGDGRNATGTPRADRG